MIAREDILAGDFVRHNMAAPNQSTSRQPSALFHTWPLGQPLPTASFWPVGKPSEAIGAR